MAYTVKSGDTLYNLYGSNWKQLSGYTGDPTKLQVGTQLPDLPKSSSSSLNPPTSSTPSVTVPESTVPQNIDLSQVNAANASTQTILDLQKQQMDKKSAELASAQAIQAKKPTSTLDWLKGTGQQTPTEFASTQYANLGINPTDYFNDLKAQTAKIDSLNKDLNDTIAARDQQIAAVTGRAGQSLDFMNNQIAQINRNANVVINQKQGNINTESALMQAKQGNFDQARSFISDAVTAYTAQLTNDLNMTMDFYNTNQDLINSLGSDYDKAFNDYINTLKGGLEQAKADAQQKIENSFRQQGLDLQTRQENRLSGGGGGDIDGSDWKADTLKAFNDIQNEGDWGSNWNRIKSFYPNKTNAEIDAALGKVVNPVNTALQVTYQGQTYEFADQASMDEWKKANNISNSSGGGETPASKALPGNMPNAKTPTKTLFGK